MVSSNRVLAIAIMGAVSLEGAARGEDEVVATDREEFARHIAPFLEQHCVRCHGAEKQKADFALHDLDGAVTGGRDVVRWEMILEMLSVGDMPPEDEGQPTRAERTRVTTWIAAELRKIGRGHDEGKLALPHQGNRIDHVELFSGVHRGPSWSPARLWRKSPAIHDRFASEVRTKLSQPFLGLGGRGIQDYASLFADESTIKTMLRNSNLVAAALVSPERTHVNRHLNVLFREGASPSEEEVEAATRELFLLIFQREPSADDRARYLDGLFRTNRELGGLEMGFRTLITAMLMSQEFVFRREVGMGEALPDGRRMLSPMELAYALSYAFRDEADPSLLEAAREGRLRTRADVAREVRRILDTPDAEKHYWHYPMYHRWGEDYYAHRPRVLRFFQEFFGYPGVVDVFKDKERNGDHHALRLRKDADMLVLHVLEQDRDVLAELLTTNRYPMDYLREDKMAKLLLGTNEKQLAHYRTKYGEEFAAIAKSGMWPGIDTQHVSAYNIDRKAADALRRLPGDVVELPAGERAGMLTHPAWLVAHSGNFDNDPIRRGKWIREHLLADLVPEVPIGVDARVPEDRHRTLRERMEVVRKEECWRCHKKMNPLGMAFESYDDFGRFRERIVVGDADGYFKKLRQHEGQVERSEAELAKWRALDAAGRAAKVTEAEERLAGLQRPAVGVENHPAKQRQYEKDVARWTGERERWSAVTDADQRREIAALERKLGELVPPVAEARPVDAHGGLRGTGEAALDGPVEDAIDLVHRLARSERARQSFVRHAFRYWMGRNETLDDSPTLIAADGAYVAGGGSFKELLVSLLSSDSFLYRK